MWYILSFQLEHVTPSCLNTSVTTINEKVKDFLQNVNINRLCRVWKILEQGGRNVNDDSHP